jgi:hypothetical protein
MSNQMTCQLEVERELAQPEELNKKQRLIINVDTPEGLDLLENLYGLTSEDQHYETIFFLDFYGNIFYYSKMMDDSQRNYYLSNGMTSIGFADLDYHYYLELCFQAQMRAEEELLLDQCINSLEENKCPLLEDLEIETEEQYSDDELTDLYYSEIYYELYQSGCFIEKAIENFDQNSIRDFKIWFRDKFVHGVDINEEDHLKYKWNNELTLTLMNMSLRYLDDQYALHKVGGCCPSWDRLELFLHSLANEPFEAELFELVEGNFELFVDED